MVSGCPAARIGKPAGELPCARRSRTGRAALIGSCRHFLGQLPTGPKRVPGAFAPTSAVGSCANTRRWRSPLLQRAGSSGPMASQLAIAGPPGEAGHARGTGAKHRLISRPSARPITSFRRGNGVSGTPDVPLARSCLERGDPVSVNWHAFCFSIPCIRCPSGSRCSGHALYLVKVDAWRY